MLREENRNQNILMQHSRWEHVITWIEGRNKVAFIEQVPIKRKIPFEFKSKIKHLDLSKNLQSIRALEHMRNHLALEYQLVCIQFKR